MERAGGLLGCECWHCYRKNRKWLKDRHETSSRQEAGVFGLRRYFPLGRPETKDPAPCFMRHAYFLYPPSSSPDLTSSGLLVFQWEELTLAD
ncbi:hypothetical protein SKAU_G00259210 [Synaphobranchus kaupii]|uniref:Uncharacterized protein n=1 Tax=Synaphobranchus kaupii TaxID=118154 RepID=A0A9Q1F4H7_SYNKA|nr:hypothetical protein SKAU_G00259210 [Synaphobranchus kaupii]